MVGVRVVGEVEAVIIQAGQPVKVPAQIREGHAVKETSVVTVEQIRSTTTNTDTTTTSANTTTVGEVGGVAVAVVRLGQELLEHVLRRVVEEALGGGVHE